MNPFIYTINLRPILVLLVISNNKTISLQLQLTIWVQLGVKNMIGEVLLLWFTTKAVVADFSFMIHQSCNGSQGTQKHANTKQNKSNRLQSIWFICLDWHFKKKKEKERFYQLILCPNIQGIDIIYEYSFALNKKHLHGRILFMGPTEAFVTPTKLEDLSVFIQA